MRRSFLVAPIVPAIAIAAVMLGSTSEAKAGPTVDLTLNLGTAFQSGPATTNVDFSLGGGLGLGYRFNIPRSILYVQPEVVGEYMRFGFNSNLAYGYQYAGDIKTGIRAGIKGIVQPNIFGHLGLGFLGRPVGLNTTELSIGPQMDVGAGLDIQPVRGFMIGLDVAYHAVPLPSYQTLDAAKWVSFGLKAGWEFGQPRPRRVYVRRRY
jgi:hypothetical protein